jgi:uncharacterized repeat protein (TIGR01451 family)
MKNSVVLQGLAGLCLAATVSVASGQNTAIQLFGPVNVRTSTQGTGYGDSAVTFNTTNLNLSCAAPIHAVLSSNPSGTGNVLVDNFITLSVGGGTAANLCSGGTTEHGGQQNCFTTTYGSKANYGGLNGTNPDTLLPAGGVPPIDISSYLTSGPVQAQIGLVDTGSFLTGSSLYLVTNCTPGGVTGPGQVTGNPIPQNNPTTPQLAQSFSFNSADNQVVQLTYDLSEAENAGSLTIKDGVIPKTTDTPIDPSIWQSQYVPGTSFATSNCLIHTGELFNGSPACKLYTLTCQVGTDPSQAGALCPSSLQRNEIFEESFDGPSFTLPDISVPNGPTFHQGVGLLEAKDGWSGGTCIFDPNSSVASALCPQNLLTTFSGPGLYKSGGRTQEPNSTFISVAPVPEVLTTVSVTGQQPGNWINSHSATVNFVSTPPTVPASIPGAGSFVAAPIASLTYGLSTTSGLPQPGPPVPGDIVLQNSTQCPAPGSSNYSATVFTPPAQSVSVPQDGNYLIHYLAQDCAGTEELKFTQTAGSWSTSFYTYPLNVDTVAPVVLSGPTLSPAASPSYVVGQPVTATYRCTDDRSGVVQCGTSTYPPGSTLDTGNLTSPVDTSKVGPGTFTVTVVDAAGNQATASVSYQVVAAPVRTSILKLAAPRVKHGNRLTYLIGVANFGRQAASSVSITDPLPAGVTFVQANAQQYSCNRGRCTNLVSCSFANNTVSCTSPSLTITTPIVVEIVVRVQAQAGSKISNTATLSTAEPAVSPANTQSTATTSVQ